jgi:hypothetical protein
MKEKLGMNRLELGEMSRVRLFESKRPKPIEPKSKYEPLPESPDSLEKVPEALESLNRRTAGRPKSGS